MYAPATALAPGIHTSARKARPHPAAAICLQARKSPPASPASPGRRASLPAHLFLFVPGRSQLSPPCGTDVEDSADLVNDFFGAVGLGLHYPDSQP